MVKNSESKTRIWNMLCHLSALAGFIGIPFGHLLGPLVIWLIKKDEYPSINEHGKEALNFQISMTIYGLLATVFVFIIIGIPLLIGLALFDLVMVIIAAVKTSNGESFQYPCTLRFVK